MRGQCLDTKRFRRVMAAVKNVQTQFFSQGECPMRTFPGDKSVNAFSRRSF
jgi:hypothetical protein